MVLTKSLEESIKKYSLPFENDMHLSPLIEAIGDVKYVLLGEATHGTSEFYTTRTEITKKLVQEKNFTYIAVEGDWPSCYEVNRYVKGYNSPYSSAKEVLQSFNRWPTWMWANEEILDLVEWLKKYNESQDVKVGFYGLDVYSLWESMEAMIGYLEDTGSPDLDKVKSAFECFEPFHRKAEEYGISAAIYGENCRKEVTELLQAIVSNRKRYENDQEASLNLEVNALVTSNAEQYYHAMITNDNESWNIRDHHMVEALEHISSFYGTRSKGIVWEHNTHIGDARATDMARSGHVNVGQLTREKYGQKNVFTVGFGTYEGTVIASTKWATPHSIMQVPKAVVGSWEYYLHRARSGNCILIFNEDNRDHFNDTIGHRAIGVIYHPEYEHLGNYVSSRVSERYDSFIFIDVTKALVPISFQNKTL